MSKKPFSDPRWREWPKKGIIASGKPNKNVQKATQDFLKILADKKSKDK